MCVQWSLHVLSCPKGGLVITRYNELWKLTAEILGEVCKNVVIEPLLAPLTGEELSKSLNTCNQAWANAYELEGHGWTGKAAFCDVRVFNPLAKCNLHHSLPAVYKNNETKRNGSITANSSSGTWILHTTCVFMLRKYDQGMQSSLFAYCWTSCYQKKRT